MKLARECKMLVASNATRSNENTSMSRPSHPIPVDLTTDDFEIAWFRRTDALADPVVRARSLCGEIARRVAADRVSYLTTHGSTFRVLASSATAAIDHRSKEASQLRKLAEEVCRTGSDLSKMSPASDAADTASETLAIPIMTGDTADTVESVVVLQRYTREPTSLAASTAAVRPHIDAAATEVATALRTRVDATDRRGAQWWQHATNWQRLAAIASLAVGIVVLLNVPITFRLPVEGRLEPARSFGVFAPAAGTLVELHVGDGVSVATGELLAELSNVEIDIQQERLSGEHAAAETELASLRLRQSESASIDSANPAMSGAAQDPASGRSRQMVLRSRVQSLREQSHLMDQVKQSMTMQSPINGRVVLRDQQADLVGQSISQSQWLMQIVDPTGGYEAILDLPEMDDAYLRRALRQDAAPVATLRLLASPDLQFSGGVSRLADSVQINERGKAAIEVTVAIREPLPDDVHVGATVVGTIDVGKRSLGFLWFRPMIEFLRSYGW